MSRLRYADLPIRAKLLAPFVILLVVWGGFGSYVLARGQASEARARATATLTEAMDRARASFADAERQLLETVRLASHTEGVPAAVAAEDSGALSRLLLPIAANTAGKERREERGLRVEAVDEGGRVLVAVDVRTGTARVETRGLRDEAAVRRAAAGRSDRAGDKWSEVVGGEFIVAGPVRDARGRAVGALVVSETIDVIVRRMAVGTTARVVLFERDGSPLASSSDTWLPYRSARGGLRESVAVGEDRVEALYGPLHARGVPVATIAIGITADAALGAAQRTATMLALMVGLAVLAVVAIGLLTARAIIRPLGSLLDATRALERGDLAARASADASDEVGTLAASFNRMADELQASHEELERKVADRTAELEDANYALARASAAKSSFLAAMSHELRTPLNAIIGFADMIRDPAFGPLRTGETRQLGENILVSGRHLLTLINDVLDLAKVEAGRIDIEPRPTDVAAVVGEVLQVVRPLVDAKRLELGVRGALGVPSVMADPARLRQVLFNLVSNAIKFTPEDGHVTVAITPARTEVSVTVTDTGPGLSPGEAERIFQPFERGRASRSVEGAGLGLALARHLVELQGGRIWASGRPGKGSTFGFTVPVAVGVAPVVAGDAPAPIVVDQDGKVAVHG